MKLYVSRFFKILFRIENEIGITMKILKFVINVKVLVVKFINEIRIYYLMTPLTYQTGTIGSGLTWHIKPGPSGMARPNGSGWADQITFQTQE